MQWVYYAGEIVARSAKPFTQNRTTIINLIASFSGTIVPENARLTDCKNDACTSLDTAFIHCRTIFCIVVLFEEIVAYFW